MYELNCELTINVDSWLLWY